MTDARQPLGRVAAPPEHESTSGVFFFWVDKDRGVERTQVVTTTSKVGDREVKFVGIVQEVYRRSRQKDIGEEAARFDGRSGEKPPPFDSEGITYAEVAILRTTPVAHTPPTEESEVFLATPQEAREGYGVDKMKQRLDVGLLKNGGTAFAGTAAIDLAFLLGENGGHLNVNGIAGLGTKSTLLLTMNWLLLREAERQLKATVSGPRLQVVPVIFNVKNFDLFFIDRWNREYKKGEPEYRADWTAMGVDAPRPFASPTFFAPQAKGLTTPVNTGGRTGDVKPYSWSLADIIEQRLFTFLFSDDDVQDANFGGLVGEMEEWLTSETAAGPKLRKDAPRTFQELLDEFRENRDALFTDFVKGTKGKLLRRLKFVVQEGDGVLRRNDTKGSPLLIPAVGQTAPIVIDLCGIQDAPSLQRFVVAAVFHQVQQTQKAKQTPHLKYLITLDELNRFAPKDSHDPITQKLETVASEGRSQASSCWGRSSRLAW